VAVDLRPMVLEDCVGVTLRREDALECRMSGARDDADALRTSLRLSQVALTWRIDGKPAAFAGLVVERPREGTPWLLTTDAAREKPHHLFRMAYRFLQLQPCDVLHQHVDASYQSAFPWLERLGWQADAPAPWGPFGHLFRRIEWRREWIP